jgi:hypothetical protein
MRIVPSTEEHIQWIVKKIDHLRISDSRGISAISDQGELYCICLMDSWTPGSVQVHIAIENPLGLKNYTFLYEVFNYIFNVGDRQTAIGFVSSENTKALKFDKKIGFKEIARIRDGARKNVDTIILELHRDDCKWIKCKEEAA